jgi:hypothetical protein
VILVLIALFVAACVYRGETGFAAGIVASLASATAGFAGGALLREAQRATPPAGQSARLLACTTAPSLKSCSSSGHARSAILTTEAQSRQLPALGGGAKKSSVFAGAPSERAKKSAEFDGAISNGAIDPAEFAARRQPLSSHPTTTPFSSVIRSP